MHTDNGLKESFVNPVLKGNTPNANVLTALYVVPGAPVDAKGNVRICNVSGGDQTFSIGWSTSSQSTVTYLESASTVQAGCSLDLFSEVKWFPPTATIWVLSSGGGIQFTYQGVEIASTGATPNFTGS